MERKLRFPLTASIFHDGFLTPQETADEKFPKRIYFD